MAIRRGWALSVGCLVFAACASMPRRSELVGPPAALAVGRVEPRTVLPTHFAHGLAPETVSLVTVSPGIVRVSQIERPHAELRLGPGPQYELADAVLEHGTEVLLVGRYGVWRKVLVPGAGGTSWQSGWVHALTLATPKLNKRPMQIPVGQLPTVLVTHAVASASGFAAAPMAAVTAASPAPPPATALTVAIPKGALFRLLRRDATRALVWLPSTSSVLWLSRKDVQ